MMPFRPVDARLRDDAQRIVIDAVHEVFGQRLLCAIGKGSAYFGDFIPFWSDLDVHVTLANELDAESAMLFQEKIGTYNPEDFQLQQFQVFFLRAGAYPADWGKPAADAYHVLAGDYAEPAPTRDESLAAARGFLADLPRAVATLTGGAVDKYDGALHRSVRLAGCYVKSGLYNFAAVAGPDPVGVWSHSVEETLQFAESRLPDVKLRRFYEAIGDWRETRQNPAVLRGMMRIALIGLRSLATGVTGTTR